jgi:hypothetical protein
MRRMATSSWPKHAVIFGSVLLFGAAIAALSLMALERRLNGIDSILIYAVPLALLTGLVGAVLALIGTIRWAFDLPSQTLAVAGIVLIALGFFCFVIFNNMNIGFDDPTALFGQLLVFAPVLLGVVSLIFAAARRGHA